MFYLQTLGKLLLHADGPSGPVVLRRSKALALCAVLATMRGYSARRSYLAELLWPGIPQDRARNSLRQTLHYLFERTGGRLIDADDSTLTLDTGQVAVDVIELENAVQEGDHERVVSLYSDRFMADYDRQVGRELEQWIEARNARLQSGFSTAVHRVVPDMLYRKRPEQAVRVARRFADANPFDETAQALLVETLKTAGEYAAASQAYEAYRTLIRAELDCEPSARLQELANELDRLSRQRSAARIAERELVARIDPGPRSESSRPSERRWSPKLLMGGSLALAAGIVLVLALLLVGESRPKAALSASPLDEIAADLVVRFKPDGGKTEVLRLEFDGGRVSVHPTQLDPLVFSSPDGSLAAYEVAGARGVDIEILDRRTGSAILAASADGDERNIEWSPDGRKFLYHNCIVLDGGRRYRCFPWLFDVESGKTTRFNDMGGERSFRAAWSPDGTRIAFVADADGQQAVFVAGVDGGQPIRVSGSYAGAERPAWSRDAAELAFVSVGPLGSAVFVAKPDGSSQRKVAQIGGNRPTVAWLSPSALAYAAFFHEYTGVWVVDVQTGDRREVARLPGRATLWSRSLVSDGSVWIDRVAIEPRVTVASPGQLISMHAIVRDQRREIWTAGTVPISWSTPDTLLAEFLRPGLLRVLGAGPITVVANARGWRADTLTIESRPLVAADVEPVLIEDWTEGLRPERWILLGEPLPYTRPAGGPDGGGVFVSNGDENYASGVVSRRIFAMDDGLTLEAWGRMPFTGAHYEDYLLQLSSVGPPVDSVEWLDRQTLAIIAFNGHNRLIRIAAQGQQTELPFPDDVWIWRLYALQVDADGTISLIVDGRLYWQSPVPVDTEEPVHVGVLGTARTSEIAHGPVRVYRGSKYVLPRAPPRRIRTP